MPVKIASICIDTDDATRASEFWQKVTGYDVAFDMDGYVMLSDPAGAGASLAFQVVPEPRAGKNRIHVDLSAEDLDAEVDRILGLGATEVRRVEEAGFRWVTLTDADGNEFDVVAA